MGERWQLSTIRKGPPGSKGNASAALQWPPSPATRGRFHPGQYPSTKLAPPFCTSPGPWVILSFSIVQLNLLGYTTGTRVPVTKLPSHSHYCPFFPHPYLIVPLAPLKDHTASNRCFEEDPHQGISPLQSFLHTHRSSTSLGPLLQIFRTHLGSSTNNTTTCNS